MLSIESFIADLTRSPLSACTVAAHRIRPPSPQQNYPLPDRFPPWLQDMLRIQGLAQLTSGQRVALEALDSGQHVYFMAPSGRRIVRLLTLYQSPETASPGHSLHIFPHKPRSRMQLQTLLAWNDLLTTEHQRSAAIYDGDTPVTERRHIRQRLPHLILTTPDMLHAGILAYHSGWRTFFQNLRYIVLADVHLCAGALATHLCHLLRRLYRLALHYGARPQFLLTSAPLSGADVLAQTLTGHSCQIVLGETWRQCTQHRLILRTQSDIATTTQQMKDRLDEARLPCLILEPPNVFETLIKADTIHPSVSRSIPVPTINDFHDAERQLLQNQATQISLSHDIEPTLIQTRIIQVLVYSGTPSSLIHLHGWLARLDHSIATSLSLLILEGDHALDHHMLHHPELYEEDEPFQFLPAALHNIPVLYQHILCAASEAALRSDGRYPGVANFTDHLQHLVSQRLLTRRSASQRWVATENRPHRRLSLRWYERPFSLIDVQRNRRLGRLSAAQAFRAFYEGAQYRHPEAGTFHVERYDNERYRITLHPELNESPTRARIQTSIHTQQLISASMSSTFDIVHGRLNSTQRIRAFERLNSNTYLRQSVHVVTGHEQHHDTYGTWLRVSAPHEDEYRMTALHAVIHALLAVVPMMCLGDEENIHAGMYPTNSPEQSHLQAIFMDTHDGGNGVSLTLFQHDMTWLGTALSLLQECDCVDGCRRCMVSYCDTCQEYGRLDRAAAIDLLQRMLGTVVAPDVNVLGNPPVDGDPRHLYLCLTTQKTSDDVGGWQNKHLLRLGLATTYDSQDGYYRVYTEESVASLIAALHAADVVIGFNIRDFDYQILQAYTERALPMLPTCAILDDIQQALGYRVSFRNVLQATLGVDRPDDSLTTVDLYREGHIEQLINLCRRDIDFMQKLIRYGVENGTLWHHDRLGQRSVVSVNWPFITNRA